MMNAIIDSSFTAIVNAPLTKIDLPDWAFALPDREYQGCSPAAATPRGRREE